MAKFLKNLAGVLTEEAAIVTSAGAGDTGKIPALNAAGVLDATIVNATIATAGAADAGKVVQLDAAGKIDQSLMPVGIGADTQLVTTSEAISAGELVNVWDDAGTPKVRKADATMGGKEAHGFVLTGAGAGAPATVYFEGTNNAVTGLTPGNQFLATTAGSCSATAPSGTGEVVQRVGFATSATTMNFQSGIPITLA